MPANLRIFSRNFEMLEDFTTVEFGERNHILNGIGQASFKVALKDQKSKRKVLRPGNIARIDSTITWHAWVGRIDRIAWNDDDSITCYCNSREALLDGVAFEGKITSTHDIAELIDKFSHDPDTRLTGIHIGEIYSDTLDEADTINASGKFTDAINQLATALDAEWMVLPSSGKFNFVKQIGSDRSHDIVIEQSEDLFGFPNITVDTSNLIWYCKAVAPSDKADETRFGEFRDDEIRNWLGGDVRQRIIHISETLRDSTLEQKAKAEVEKSLGEVFTFDFTINNNRRLLKRGNNFWLGDIITLNLPTIGWGLKGKVRIHGIGINEENSEIRLICKPHQPRHWLHHFSK